MNTTSNNLPSIRQRIALSFEYPVHFTQRAFDCGNPLLHETLRMGLEGEYPRRTAVIVDREVARLHGDLIRRMQHYFSEVALDVPLTGAPLIIEGGEACKNTEDGVRQILHFVHERNLCRQSVILAIGGGAFIDTVGFAASISHRGIPIVRMPTTVLAQNDASLAVKNGVNAYGKKNFLGTFTPPKAVICDSTFLTTLQDRDWRAGIAEAIKVALLKDAAFFTWIEQHAEKLVERDLGTMETLIHRCAELHLTHIATSGDPFEHGASRPLDFGHWSAHKLEALSNHALRHGEAVAIGLGLDALYSRLSGWLHADDCDRIHALIRAVQLPLYTPLMHEYLDTPTHSRCFLHGLEEFRQHLGGPLTVMMLKAIGHGYEVNTIDLELMRQAADALREEARHPSTALEKPR